MINTRVIIDETGDIDAAKRLLYFAETQQFILHNLMSFRDLKQDVRTVNMADGSVIIISSCYDQDTIYISCPKVVEEEFVSLKELVECITSFGGGVNEYRYWNSKDDTFFKVPGNDGISREVYNDVADFSKWRDSLKRGFYPLAAVGQVGSDGKNYVMIKTSLSDTVDKLGVDSSWFISAGKAQFWQEIKSVVWGGTSWWSDLSHPLQEVNNIRLEVEKPFPDSFPNYDDTGNSAYVSPRVPLYVPTERFFHTKYASGGVRNTDTLDVPVNIRSDSEGNCWCEANGTLLVTSSNGHGEFIDVITGSDNFPWETVSLTSGDTGPASAYSSFEDHPVCGGGSSSSVSGNVYSDKHEYIACNTKFLWENKARSPFIYSTLSTVSIDEETGSDYGFLFNPVACVNGAPGCNDACRTYQSKDWMVSKFINYTKNISAVSTPFGDVTDAHTYSYHLEGDGGTLNNPPVLPNPPDEPSYSEGGGVFGLFTRHTILTVFSMYRGNSDSAKALGEWRDSTYGVNPEILASPSNLNNHINYTTTYDVVILR